MTNLCCDRKLQWCGVFVRLSARAQAAASFPIRRCSEGLTWTGLIAPEESDIKAEDKDVAETSELQSLSSWIGVRASSESDNGEGGVSCSCRATDNRWSIGFKETAAQLVSEDGNAQVLSGERVVVESALQDLNAQVASLVTDAAVTSEETDAQVASGETKAVAKRFRPRLPVIFYRLKTKSRLKVVRQYIASFEYNLKLQTNFNTQKQRPLSLIMETAKTIINTPLPIKCVEAVFVALLLTAGLPYVERFPLSFQTVLDGQVYQHIVLLVQHFNNFGAFGISRWPEFGSKDVKFDSMSSVIDTYRTAYEAQHHIVEKLRVGLPVEHNVRSANFVSWRYLELDLQDDSWSECAEEIDKFAAQGRRLWDLWIHSRKDEYPRQIYIRKTKCLLASRESSPLKTRRLNLESSITVHGTVNAVIGVTENPESAGIGGNINIQELSSEGPVEATLSLELGENSGAEETAEKAAHPDVRKQLCFIDKSVAVRNPSNRGFDKFRRIKKFFKTGTAQSEDDAVGSVKSKRALRSRPRSARSAQSADRPLVVSPSLLGTKSLNGTPCNGLEGAPKSCWECLRRVYRTKNEARLLLLKDKLADLRMQGPVAGESFRVVQDIFQLVGIGQATKIGLDVFEGTIDSLSEAIDAVVQSVYSQKELHSLKQLATQLAEMRISREQAMREKNIWNSELFVLFSLDVYMFEVNHQHGLDANAQRCFRIQTVTLYYTIHSMLQFGYTEEEPWQILCSREFILHISPLFNLD